MTNKTSKYCDRCVELSGDYRREKSLREFEERRNARLVRALYWTFAAAFSLALALAAMVAAMVAGLI